MLVAITIAAVATLLLGFCIMARSWHTGEYGVFLMSTLIVILMVCILPVLGKLQM
jgi:hypothetical protein